LRILRRRLVRIDDIRVALEHLQFDCWPIKVPMIRKRGLEDYSSTSVLSRK
jgi:hypothetical protein